MSLIAVDRFSIPTIVIQETDRALRHAGQAGCECFVLWSGVVRDRRFCVQTYHLPTQTRYRSPNGLSVRIDGAELHRLNRWLFDVGEVLGVQVHSHPTTAFHSDTDNAYPIVTLLGGLSIVVPHFGRAGLQGGGVAVFRLESTGWMAISTQTASTLLEFGT